MMRVVSIGASHGGVEALCVVVAGLPSTFAAPLLIAQHIGCEHSTLPAILSDAGALSASHAIHGEPIEAGHIYVAPPDRHLLAVAGRLELWNGPRENWARPAIDPLFRSVAQAFGPNAVGVVLTGYQDDGTSGLVEIKRCGGIAVVEYPATARASYMPQNALSNVSVDYCLPVSEIAAQLIRLVNESSDRAVAKRLLAYRSDRRRPQARKPYLH